MRATLEAAAATSAGQYNVGLKTLLGMRVLLPSREEVRRLIAAVDASASVTEACERELNATLLRCARLRQSILRLTFDGRLVPQDPRDEPASVFLDRIRRERPAEAPTPRRKSTRSRA
jgi:type I restriction enzyme S subunit